ncbi:MAG: hypothetical protein Q4D61_08485 [Cardiobacteriaceae bacterium]|nr:hypothetical protein [Cardiobacteriaceae bacterium]
MKHKTLIPLILAAGLAHSAEPIRTIDIHVTPYYAAGNPPQINIGLDFQQLLASDKREDILAARDRIAANPAGITPMSMMVLAIRLYDVGERDESVFWHYAAKNRFYTLMNAVDPDASGLFEARHAMNAFVELAGPYHNSYAFCERDRQPAIAKRAIDWVEANPYAAIDHPNMVPLPGGTQENVKKTIAKLRDAQQKEAEQLNDPAFWQEFQQQRRDKGVDEQFCWK